MELSVSELIYKNWDCWAWGREKIPSVRLTTNKAAARLAMLIKYNELCVYNNMKIYNIVEFRITRKINVSL